MLSEARAVPKNTVIRTEVCIVGAGAAGITLAREFAGRGFRVCLLESGGFEYDENTQALYAGENVGLPYFKLDAARLRYFGGSTNHWSGLCRPLDEIDFEQRDWVPYSGWPFDKSHLAPFYDRAEVICQLRPGAYDAETWETETRPRLPFVQDGVLTQFLQFSPPTLFGRAYRDEIIRAPNIDVYLNANVVDIETTSTARRVTRLRVSYLGGDAFWVTGKIFILAAGGIENPRLLLLSNKVLRTGLGNKNDLVGRFFMEHPHLKSGMVLLSSNLTSLGLYEMQLAPKKVDSANPGFGSGLGALTLSPHILRKEKLLNYSTSLELIPEPGLAAARDLYNAAREGRIAENFTRDIKEIIRDMDAVIAGVYRKALNSGSPPMEGFQLHNRLEQAPNPESRVTLSEERDSLGLRRVRLDWRLTDLDKRSLRRAHEILGQEVGRAGLGRFKIELDEGGGWPSSLMGGFHHMGTTRMGQECERGVVDVNCLVHGISNLYIAGSSVFPTSGYANPTLTIVALALRLADHVNRLMK